VCRTLLNHAAFLQAFPLAFAVPVLPCWRQKNEELALLYYKMKILLTMMGSGESFQKITVLGIMGVVNILTEVKNMGEMSLRREGFSEIVIGNPALVRAMAASRTGVATEVALGPAPNRRLAAVP
jgi:hypothetical protein